MKLTAAQSLTRRILRIALMMTVFTPVLVLSEKLAYTVEHRTAILLTLATLSLGAASWTMDKLLPMPKRRNRRKPDPASSLG